MQVRAFERYIPLSLMSISSKISHSQKSDSEMP